MPSKTLISPCSFFMIATDWLNSRSASAKEPLLEPSPAPAPPEAAEKKGGGSGYRGDEWAPPKAQLQSGARETGVKVKY